FGEVARRIGRMVGEGLVLPERCVRIEVTGAAGPLGADLATPLAVVLAELLQNAVEHAFPEGADGTVTVELARSDGELKMVVRDDGVGLDVAALEGSRLGLQIVRSLIEELGGTFAITSDAGTRAEVRVRART
ncbi:MAG: ATP-binding protein, partial [Actinomycetota bacterium]|nr:ATP-binding protein [Actinomycetota bacterium]